MARLQLEAQVYYRMGRCAEAISAYSELFQQHKARAALPCTQPAQRSTAWSRGRAQPLRSLWSAELSCRARATHGLQAPSEG